MQKKEALRSSKTKAFHPRDGAKKEVAGLRPARPPSGAFFAALRAASLFFLWVPWGRSAPQLPFAERSPSPTPRVTLSVAKESPEGSAGVPPATPKSAFCAPARVALRSPLPPDDPASSITESDSMGWSPVATGTRRCVGAAAPRGCTP